jgi:UDP-glucose 4-epimerase
LRTLVTGGAGFIGSHLAARLRTLGHDVRVVDNLSTGFRSNLEAIGDDLDFICGDLRDPDVCARAVEGVEVVFHLAALASVPRSIKEPIACHEHNVTATLNLLAATQPAARVSGWVVNCGAGERTSLLELIALAERVSGRPVRISPRPPREGDVRDSLASLERAHQVLGYEPLVALRDGLVRTWEWMASEASVPTAV